MIYVIIGPSGSGKTTLGDHFRSLGMKELVSHTTRKMRPGEADGISYHFVDEEEFDLTDKIEESTYSGNRYGVSKREVEEKLKGGDVFAVTDINGAKAFRRLYGGFVSVIYICSSARRLRERMRDRGDSKESIRARIRVLKDKQEYRNRFFADHVIENNGSVRTFLKQGGMVIGK
jgi:guanylate kinase